MAIPEFHRMLLERHSIRKYTEKPLPADDVKLILEAALLSPSSKSVRPWQFVVAEDKAVLEKLSTCKKTGAVSLKTAVMAVVVVAEPEKSDMYVEDASVAALMMQLQAEALGIGSCWVQIAGRYGADDEPAQELVQQCLGIPENLPVICIITFGYKNEVRKPVDPEKLLWEKVHIGQWRNEQ